MRVEFRVSFFRKASRNFPSFPPQSDAVISESVSARKFCALAAIAPWVLF